MRPSTELNRLLSTIEPRHRRRKVQEAIDHHFSEPGRRNRRGRDSKELKSVCRTVRQIRSMQDWCENGSYDLSTRRRIKDFLKHIDHRQPWLTTVQECREARGLVNKAGRRRNERREYGPSEPIVLDKSYTAVPLNSIAKLRSAGKRGKNCLGDSYWGTFDELKDRETEFYEIRRSGAAVAWMSIDVAERIVADMEGKSRAEVDLPTEVLWKICRKFNVNCDDSRAFLQRGVLSIFKDGHADPSTPMLVVNELRLWSRREEIVVYDSKHEQWSRLTWCKPYDEEPHWSTDGYSHMEDQTFEFLCRFVPQIESLARNARTKEL